MSQLLADWATQVPQHLPLLNVISILLGLEIRYQTCLKYVLKKRLNKLCVKTCNSFQAFSSVMCKTRSHGPNRGDVWSPWLKLQLFISENEKNITMFSCVRKVELKTVRLKYVSFSDIYSGVSVSFLVPSLIPGRGGCWLAALGQMRCSVSLSRATWGELLSTQESDPKSLEGLTWFQAQRW